MHTMAGKLAALRLVESDVAASAESEARFAVVRECNTAVDAERVKEDIRAQNAEIRRIRTESRRRWHERAAEYEAPVVKTAPAPPRSGSVPAYYSPDRKYAVGDEVRHDGFGDGEVIAVERRQMTVRFPCGEIGLMLTPAPSSPKPLRPARAK